MKHPLNHAAKWLCAFSLLASPVFAQAELRRAAVGFVPWRKLPACESVGKGKLEARPTVKFSSAARLKLPAIFSDHMVLQQKRGAPIWGWDQPGTEVTVNFGDQMKKATAGKDDKWAVKLEPLDASAKPAILKIQGAITGQINDVLVGEVWVCSGQSNMLMKVRDCDNADDEIAAANYPQMRQMETRYSPSDVPQADLRVARWEVATPENAPHFTAVGYFFGREIHKELKVPIGLIKIDVGGTSIEA